MQSSRCFLLHLLAAIAFFVRSSCFVFRHEQPPPPALPPPPPPAPPAPLPAPPSSHEEPWKLPPPPLVPPPFGSFSQLPPSLPDSPKLPCFMERETHLQEPPDCVDENQSLFKPKQCNGHSCHCVDEQGQKINVIESFAEESAPESECGCARKHHHDIEINKLEENLLFKCDHLGNFQKKQCPGLICFCVDEKTGEKSADSHEVPTAESDNLTC